MRDLTIQRTSKFARLAVEREPASLTVSALDPAKTFPIRHMEKILLDDLRAMLDMLAEAAFT